MPPDAIAAAIDSLKPRQNGGASLMPPSPKLLKVFIGPAYGRNMEPQHVQAMLALLLGKRGANMRYRMSPTWNDALLCRARSVTASAFLLDTDDDVHISIDSDVVFEPWQAEQIARQAVEYGIVGGMYVTRSRDRCRPTSIPPMGERITLGTDSTPVPFKWLATGFVATHRRVFERLAEDLPLCHKREPWRFYPFYQPFWIDVPEIDDTIYLSEDFAMIERAKQAGFTPYLAPNLRIYHLGLHPFRLEDMAQKPIDEQELVVTYHGDSRFSVETFAD